MHITWFVLGNYTYTAGADPGGVRWARTNPPFWQQITIDYMRAASRSGRGYVRSHITNPPSTNPRSAPDLGDYSCLDFDDFHQLAHLLISPNHLPW